MDACFASWKQLFADAYPHSYDQGEMARHHMRYRDLMQKWHEVMPGRILDVAYEDVAADMEPEARRIIEFLGIGWQDACLEFHKQGGAVTTASAAQVREKAHTRSVGKWRKFEDKLTAMASIINAGGIDE